MPFWCKWTLFCFDLSGHWLSYKVNPCKHLQCSMCLKSDLQSQTHTHKKVSMQLFSFQYSLHWWVTPTSYYISRSYVGQQYWQSRPKIQFRLEYKVGNSNTWLILNCYSISFSIIPVSKYLESFYMFWNMYLSLYLWYWVLKSKVFGILSEATSLFQWRAFLQRYNVACLKETKQPWCYYRQL